MQSTLGDDPIVGDERVFYDEESIHLLGSRHDRRHPYHVLSSSSSGSSNSCTITRKLVTALALASLVCFSLGVFLAPDSFLDIMNHNDGSISKSMIMMKVFSSYEKTTGGNSNSKELIFLDRHDLNCGSDVVHQFHMRNSGWNSVWYQYNCMKVAPSAKLIDRYSANNGFNEDHNLIYYDRQKMYCDSGYLLTRFYGQNNNNNFGYAFECSKFDVEDLQCQDYYTNYNEATDKEIIFLDRHDVRCPEDMGMQGFEGGSSNGQLRYVYKCCELKLKMPTASPTMEPLTSAPSEEPTMKPTEEPSLQPTAMPSELVQPTATLQPTVIATFEHYEKKTNPNANSKELVFIDRHHMDCGEDAMGHFQMRNIRHMWMTLIYFQYTCLKVKNHAKVIDRITKDNGFDEGYNLLYMDRQRVYCDEGYLLTNLYGRNNNGKFGYGFDCVKYDLEAMECKQYYTNYNEALEKEIVYLDRHDVRCPDDTAMQGFEGQSNPANRLFRIAYICCQLYAKAPTAAPTVEPTFPLPTRQPSVQPSLEPTEMPSEQPVASPTLNPTLEPTLEPVAEPTLFPTMANLNAGKYFIWGDINKNLLWSGEASPHDCEAACNIEAECTAWETCNYGKSSEDCSGCYLINRVDIPDPLEGSDKSFSAALFVMGDFQGKLYPWNDISNNILWSGEATAEDCEASCENNVNCTAWEICNFGKPAGECAGCYLINKRKIGYPTICSDKKEMKGRQAWLKGAEAGTAPTAEPISSPTAAPTIMPSTVKPTAEPSVAPSFEPSYSPVPDATEVPTVEPSLEPVAMPTLFPTLSNLDAGKYYDWEKISNNILWSGEATPTACRALCDERLECTGWETCNYGKVSDVCSGCYLLNKQDLAEPLRGSDQSYSAGVFVMGPDQGKNFDWNTISTNILWSGELPPADCKSYCETNENCTAWQTCNFGKTSSACSGCYLINKVGIDFPVENGDKSWQAAIIEVAGDEEDVVKESPTLPNSESSNITVPAANTTESAPAANTTESAPIANVTESSPVANATTPTPDANITESAPVANTTAPPPVANATEPQQSQNPMIISTDMVTAAPSVATTVAPSVATTNAVSTMMPTVLSTEEANPDMGDDSDKHHEVTDDNISDDYSEGDESKNQGSGRKDTYDDDNIRQHSGESSHESIAYPTNYCIALSTGPLLDRATTEQPAHLRVCHSKCPEDSENCVTRCAGSEAFNEAGLIDRNGKSLVQYVYLGKKIKATLFSKKDKMHKTLYYTYKDNQNEAYSLNEEFYQVFEDGELVDGPSMEGKVYAATVALLSEVDSISSC